MSTMRVSLFPLALLLTAYIPPCKSQIQGISRNRLERVAQLSKELRWHVGGPSREEYERTKNEVTQRLMHEIDGFVEESFQPEDVISFRANFALIATTDEDYVTSLRASAFARSSGPG